MQHDLNTGDGATDPGWGAACRRAWIPPQLNLAATGLGGTQPLLVRYRAVVVSALLFTVAMGAILALVIPLTSDTSLFPLVLVPAVIGIAASVAVPVIERRLYQPGAEGEGAVGQLLYDHRTAFATNLALAQSAALAGFVISFQTDSMVPYLVGGGLTLVALALAAPTRSKLARIDQKLAACGRQPALSTALMLTGTESPPVG